MCVCEGGEREGEGEGEGEAERDKGDRELILHTRQQHYSYTSLKF